MAGGGDPGNGGGEGCEGVGGGDTAAGEDRECEIGRMDDETGLWVRGVGNGNLKNKHMVTAIDKKTALVVIDLQDGIVKMSLLHPGTEIVRQSARLVGAFHKAGLPVVIVKVVPFGAPSGKVRTQVQGMPKDEAGQKQAREMMEAAGFFTIVPELGAQPDDISITKKTWNAFYDTPLEEELKRLDVTGIVLCGIATSIGVEGTARAAYERGFNLTFAEDAMTDMVASAHENSLKTIFPRIGEVDTTDAIIDHLLK